MISCEPKLQSFLFFFLNGEHMLQLLPVLKDKTTLPGKKRDKTTAIMINEDLTLVIIYITIQNNLIYKA